MGKGFSECARRAHREAAGAPRERAIGAWRQRGCRALWQTIHNVAQVPSTTLAKDLGHEPVVIRLFSGHARLPLGFLSWGLLADLALEVGDVVARDDDEFPAFLTRLIEEIQVGCVPGQVAEVDFPVFPLGHFR